MKKLLVAGIAAAAFCGAPALAAPPPAPIFNWTGFYVGAHAGAAGFDNNWFVPLTPLNIAGTCPGCPTGAGSHKDSSWLAGGQVGGNYQIGSWVWGVEAQFSWTDLEGSNKSLFVPIVTNHSKTDEVGTVAGRLGIALDRTLLFVKGGGAWAHDKFFTSAVGTPVEQTITGTRWGWMVGIGAECAFAPNWSVKAEYDFTDFGRQRETLQPVGVLGGFDYDIKQTIQLVKIGVNYRFGGM